MALRDSLGLSPAWSCGNLALSGGTGQRTAVVARRTLTGADDACGKRWPRDKRWFCAAVELNTIATPFKPRKSCDYRMAHFCQDGNSSHRALERPNYTKTVTWWPTTATVPTAAKFHLCPNRWGFCRAPRSSYRAISRPATMALATGDGSEPSSENPSST